MKKHKLFSTKNILIGIVYTVIVLFLVFCLITIVKGAPSETYTRTMLPETDSAYNIGAENLEYLYSWFDFMRIGYSTTTYSTTTVSAYLGTTAGLNGVYIDDWSEITGVSNWDFAWDGTIKPTTTVGFYVNASSTISDLRVSDALNATTTNVGTLHVYTDFTTDDTGLVTNLNADQLDSQTGSYYIDWDNFINKPATSTILALLDSDYRIAELNATSTLMDSATITESLYVGTDTDVLKVTSGLVATVGSPVKNYALLWNGTAPVWAAQGTSFTFSNASFVDNQTATQEIGTGTFLAIGATSFTATYSNGPATSGSVQIVGGVAAWASALDMGGPNYIGPTASAEVVPYPANPATITFRLTASDGTDTDTSNVTINLINNRFWGITTKTSSFTEADVEGLAGSELSNSKDKTFSSTTGAGEYILWASRTALGTVTFSVDGFSGGFQAPETVSITNASGFAENYYVYRSTNLNLGTITVISD